MKRLLLIGLVLVAGCGSNPDEWAGYTEGEAKEIMGDETFRQGLIQIAPGDPATNPASELLPTQEVLDAEPLHKVTVQGEEAWEYNSGTGFCLDVWKDKDTNDPAAYVGPCNSD